MATKRRLWGTDPAQVEGPRPAVERPRPLTSLVASAQRLTSETIKEAPWRANTAKEWQSDAWEMYDLVGEQRFLASTLANRMSQARLFVSRLPEDQTDTPEPLADLPEVSEVLNALGGSPAGRAQIIGRLGSNLFVAGDAWLVGLPSHMVPGTPRNVASPAVGEGGEGIDLADLEWRTFSVNEVSVSRDGRVEIKYGSDKMSTLTVHPDEAFMIRVWRPHPRYWWEADSPTRSSLPVLRELVGLTMHISAQIDSRLAGAGLLVVPQSAQRAFRIAAGLPQDPDPEGDTSDPFTEALMEAMLTPIGDRANASALVPLIATVPDEVTDKFDYINFAKPLDTEARSLRDEAIRRLALGQDAPPEMLLGTGGMNHWGAWLVREDVVTTHIEPPLALICDAITTQYLWPALEEMGYSPQEAREFVVWYDVSHMVTRPNRASDAGALHDRNALSDAALRAANGFDESDAPPPEPEVDQAVQMALDLVSSAPSLAQDPGLPALVASIREVLGEGEVPPAPVEGEPANAERVPEPGDSDLPNTDGDDAEIT